MHRLLRGLSGGGVAASAAEVAEVRLVVEERVRLLLDTVCVDEEQTVGGVARRRVPVAGDAVALDQPSCSERTTTPFCAIVLRCPRPVTVLFSTCTAVLSPVATTPFFW